MKNDWLKPGRIRFTQFAPQFYGPDYARREIEITRRYNCDTLAFFVEMDGWLLYPSRYAELEETLGGADLFGELVRECEKENVRLIACWMGMHCQTYHLRRHPDWRCRHYSSLFEKSPFPPGSDSEQKNLLCLNSPFREVLLGEVEEVLRRWDVAGVYFDGIYRMAGYCYCDRCREKFQQRHGRSVPADPDDPDWRLFINDYSAGFSRDAKDLIRKIAPEVRLLQDCHGTLIGTYDARENIRGCAEWVDSFILESYHEYSGEAPGFVAMESRLVAAESRKPVSCARWLSYSPGAVPTLIPESGVLIWAYDVLATGGIPVAIDQGGFWYDHSLEKPLGGFLARLAESHEFFAGSESLEHVALFHSLACKDQRVPHDNLSARAHFEGFYLSLEQYHIPFDLVTEQDILAGCLAKYAAVVLPNIEFMDDDVARKIEEFSVAGGGVVATYRTSFCNGGGEVRQRPALADLLGIAKVNGCFSRGVNLASAKYDAVSLTEPAHLFESVINHPVTDGLLPGTLYNFAGAAVDMIPAAGFQSLARLRNYDRPLADSGRFFRWMPADPAQDLVMAREDQGRTVYLAGALDRAFWESGYPFVGTLLSRAVAWTASREADVEVDASPLMAARIRRCPAKKTLSIHLTNYAVNQIFLPGFAGSFLARPQALKRNQRVQHVSPECGVRIRLKTEKSVRVRSFTGQDLPCTKKGNRLEITVPLVKEGEIVIVEDAA